MSLASNLLTLATRIATEFKTTRSQFAGNTTGSLSALATTAKTSLLAAINEVHGLVLARIPSSEKGAANGVATLDGTGRIPSSQLPGFVDDVLEFANLAALPATGTAGVMYVTLNDNRIYRWSGTVYVELSAGAGGGVTTFNGRTGAVTPQVGDYTAAMVGAPTTTDVGDTNTDFVATFNTGLL